MHRPGSFTKNIGIGDDWSRLRNSISCGFQRETRAVTRRAWAESCGLGASHLIPLNFFLYSTPGDDEDLVMPDEFVHQSMSGTSDKTFGRLALFALNLANSGTWHHTFWPDGRVAGWCNEFIREVAWQNGQWQRQAFSDSSLVAFIEKNVRARPLSARKVFTNYRRLFNLAGIFSSREIDTKPWEWGISACKLFWDRLTYQNLLPSNPATDKLVEVFLEHEIYKLLGCSKDTGLVIAAKAAQEYAISGGLQRFSK